MDDCHIIGWQRKLRHKHILLTVWTCSRFSSMTRPSPPETIKMKLPSTLPVGVEPVLRSSACSPSLPRKLVRWVGRRCAACTHQWLIGGNEMAGWIDSRSYADCHKFINEHDDELVREVLKYYNSELLQTIACNSQAYTESLMFLALRMIHRNPLSLLGSEAFYSPLELAEQPQYNACKEIRKVLRFTPKYITATPFPTLLLRSLPTKHHEIYGPYNTACQFIKHMKYDKAELVEIEGVLKPARKCDVCSSLPAKPCARCKNTFYCSTECQKSAWKKKHKMTCKAPTTPPATVAELRTLHKGMTLLNMCIQRSGAGDGPTSVVVEFLLPGPG